MAWGRIQEYVDWRFRKSEGNKSERRLFDEWVSGKDIIRYSYGPFDFFDLPKYLRTGWYRGRKRGHTRCERPPCTDHTVAFKRKDGKTWIAYQPYREVEVLRPMVDEWAARVGVRAVVYDKHLSWYNPGSTCLVVIDLPEESQALGHGDANEKNVTRARAARGGKGR